MDGLLEAGRLTTPVDGTARQEIYEDIQTLWAVDAPTVSLLQEVSIVVAQDELLGIDISPPGWLTYFQIYKHKTFLPYLSR